MTFRTAMHAHSTWSYDGRWTLAQLASSFASRKYKILLMTEHDQGFTEERRLKYWEACREASTDELLIVPGIEYSDASNTVHMLVWGNIPFLGTGIETQRLLESATDKGAMVVFAHPSRREAWRLFRKGWSRHLTGIELWNRKTDGWSPSKKARVLINETNAKPFVGLDFHSRKQFFPLAMNLEIEGKPDELKIIEAFRLGTFHAAAFGMGLEHFSGPIARSVMSAVESARRTAARAVRLASSK